MTSATPISQSRPSRPGSSTKLPRADRPEERPARLLPAAPPGGRGDPRRDAGRQRRAEPARRAAPASSRRSTGRSPCSRGTSWARRRRRTSRRRSREQRNRRTIYAFRIRTLADPLLEVFNRPGSETSLRAPRRDDGHAAGLRPVQQRVRRTTAPWPWPPRLTKRAARWASRSRGAFRLRLRPPADAAGDRRCAWRTSAR